MRKPTLKPEQIAEFLRSLAIIVEASRANSEVELDSEPTNPKKDGADDTPLIYSLAK